MSNDKAPDPKQKTAAPKAAAPAAKPAPVKPAPVKVAPLFRKIDWLVLIVSFAVVWTVYLLTLAPELTLEDSGELCTASFYAGIPHPPGYPFWSIYSWLWTVILPIGNVAWRVEVGESFAAAMACGLVGFMVSRGSSMLIEGIEELKTMNRKWENAICIVTGIVAGLLLGFDGFTWKESVVINRISLFDVPWIMVVALCLLRWIYAPQQTRYLYFAMFFFGLCATIHQTLLVAAMGIEVVVAAAHPRFGRSFFLGNSIVYLMGLILTASGAISAFNGLAQMMIILFNVVGIASIAAYIWFAILTKETIPELMRDIAIVAAAALFAAVPGNGTICGLLGVAALVGFGKLSWDTRKSDLGWLVVFVCALFWLVGLSFYLYEAVSGMTNPPMEWGYPRTVDGFFHALLRGQYEKVDPTDIIHEPMRFVSQLGLLVGGIVDSYNWIGLFIALLPFLFILKMQRRERAWLIGLSAIYFCIGVFLTVLMNTSLDRQSADESKVVFTASHAIVAIMIGYGLALAAAYMSTHYEKFRRWGLWGGAAAVLLAIYGLVDATGKLYFGPGGGFASEHSLLQGIFAGGGLALLVVFYLKLRRWINSYNDPVLENLFLWGLPAVAVMSAIVFRLCSPENAKAVLSAVSNFTLDFLYSPVAILHSALPHYTLQAFAKDQYGFPVFANLILLAILVIFICALLAYRQRGPVLILLCLLTAMPAWSGLTHWYKSEQRNHWFGYWFGHDMFTPPLGIYPQIERNTIIFGGTDPGRFCPTYMIFCESFIPHNCQPLEDQKFDRRDCYLITQNALADGTYLDYLRAQYFRSQQHDPPFFSRLFRLAAATANGAGKAGKVVVNVNDEDVGKGNTGNRLIEGVADLLDHTLDKWFTALGAKIEKRRRAEGVYPPSEIYIPSEEDSRNCFQAYTEDVERRSEHDANFPNEPKEIRQGEDVHIDNGHVSVSGQVAVMMINGLLCKVIFDHNPTNEFYVEESFPLDWMYPYETPSGIIMKINRQPLPELSDDVFKKDHEFWSRYSARLIGTNVVTYDTTVQQIADFAQKVYIGNNYAGFTGDRKFIRDDGGQKAFSKLRSSIAGMYAWRLGPSCPPEYRQKTQAAQDALVRETDFAFKQSFAFCPYSPEAVFRYVNFLIPLGRIDDAIIVAETCLKLDPFNDGVKGLVNQLHDIKSQIAARSQFQDHLQKLQTEAIHDPTNFQNVLELGSLYAQMQDTNRANELFKQATTMFDAALASPNIQIDNVRAMTQIAANIGDLTRIETALENLADLTPCLPEPRYDLADLNAILGKNAAALQNLKIALDLNAKRLATNPAAHDLLIETRTDPRLEPLRKLPEFQKLVPPN